MKERVAKAVIRIFPKLFWLESNDDNFDLYIYFLLYSKWSNLNNYISLVKNKIEFNNRK